MLLFRNHHDGTFEDVSQALAAMPPQSRRGAAFGDINNDGNVDIVVLNVGEPPSLLLNHNESANHRVLFKLVGTKSNKAAMGARIPVKAGPLVQFSELRGASSYLSQNDLRLHFGLCGNSKMNEVSILSLRGGFSFKSTPLFFGTVLFGAVHQNEHSGWEVASPLLT